ncbi:membrane-associated phospholipid phosphatase [Micromonospora vinacea]|uniref:Membrane-associated phospholipid phosphatase n=1 Tax=Micromonospora vinacea TaxID=709878 RepID=A0ABS0K975_9ACTN|nr:phosphatase PAP2 family protein [Micromonospora vinacea]MBG6105197.1 membrane-associated phospholipid phosphatase [Micromonospora vinacea]
MSIGSLYSVGRSTPGPARPLPHARAVVPLGLRLLAAALCGLFALALTGAVFVRTDSGQWLDGVLLPRAERGGGYEQQTVLVDPAKSVLATFGDPTLIAVLLGVVLLVGVLRRRLVAGVVGVGMVVCAVLVASAVKSALPRPDLQIESSTTHNSFPSGHVAAATALLLAFMLVLPGWARRWLAVPGAAGVSVIASATMIAGWHRFSDVLGGVLLGVTVFCLAAAALAAWPGDRDAAGGADGGSLWRRLAETAVGLVVLVWALVVVVPGLAASVQRGLLVAIVAAAASTMFLVGAVVFLVRSTDFAVPLSPQSPESSPSTETRNIS